jgi:uncharacterized membrane protein YfcA
MQMIVAWMLAYVAAGAFVGFLAGLLGTGGGMTLVPVLAAMFAAQRFAPDHTVHLALGTGMATIMFTSSASVRMHHRLGGVDWALVRRMGPGMVVGTLPGTPALAAIGLLIGVVSGLVSAGGAFMTVPFMLYFGVAMTTAIGTGAALGVPVAMVGTLGYVFSGQQVPDLPPLALGFVYGPALLGIVAGSVLTAPMGARAAHRMPVTALRRIFACLLYVLATKMLWTYL